MHADALKSSSLSVEKPPVPEREQVVFGTPGETRTHYLTLRRRTLYPGELRRHIYLIIWAVPNCRFAAYAQQMAKCLALLGCHLHAACGRCIQVSYGGRYTYASLILADFTVPVKEIPHNFSRRKNSISPLQKLYFRI